MNDVSIRIDLARQQLDLCKGGKTLKTYSVSTSLNGPGERQDSECTPRGAHVVAEKIGAGAPPDTVFIGRQPTGETWSPELAARHPDRDWILTRILWLEGCEAGVNRGGDVDSKSRFIYIHGTPQTEPMGVPRSHGCIRMRNADVVELFDAVETGTPVEIRADGGPPGRDRPDASPE